MTNLNELNVVNREYNLEAGFFWVEFDNGKSLQLCLTGVFDNEGALVRYLPLVDIGDSGYYEGLSRDNNQWAVGEYGESEHIEEFLIEQARMCDLEIVA